MKDIRIGNDIIVSWSIFAEGAPYSLEGKEVTLYLCSQFGKRRAEGYAITGNQITWTFFGKEQKHSGKYSLELVVNEDAEGMVTTDACDFVNLVSCSCKVGGADEQGVQTESIELTSSFEFVPYDDTELRKMIEGKQDTLESGKTIKTINGQSILGEGNLEIEGGGESYDDTKIRAELTQLSAEVGKKVDADKVATINGQSLVNGGNITIEGGKGEKGDKGDKGDQGNSGYTGAADELEVVNNLTQGGATAALSAEMGKELAEEINGVDTRIVVSLDVELSGYGTKNLTTDLSKFVAGGTYKLEPHTEFVVGLQYKVNNGATQNLGRPNYEGGKWVYPEFVFPANVTYLALESRTSNVQTHIVDIIDVNGVVVEGLKEKVANLESLAPQIAENTTDIEKMQMMQPNIGGRKLYIEGASFVDWNIGFYGDNPISYGNGWFEMACERLGLLPLNKARSGSTIIDFARGISGIADAQGNKVNAAWTEEEFEEFDTLAIMHTHNYNVADTSVLKEQYDGTETFLNLPLKNAGRIGYICDQLIPEYFAQAYDYVLKEYAKKCYACKDKVGSRWYGTKMGKPFKVILCTHWHDARTTFNESVRELQQKWGFELCEFDKHIGFSKNQVNPSTGEQVSILYCDNGTADTEIINGVTYGWHPTRGKEAYIQKAMASIFADAIKPILCDSDFTK